ncbi:MAG: hypothetical protein H6Q74_2420 [Firmicutes bacterium]|nr:hypothetical protein [Bacillota bacterium]
MVSKKTLVAMMVATVVSVGVAIPYIGQAAQKSGGAPPEGGPDKMIQEMAQEFGLNQDEVAKYMHQRIDPREMMHAATLTKISGKSLTEVLSMKTLANTWEDVEKTLGVTKDQVKAFMEEARTTKLAAKLSLSKDSVAELLKNGYHPQDIGIAAVLAKDTQKSVAEVLSMKAINNDWRDVAKTLGVDENTFKQDIDKLHEGMPGPKGPRPGQPGPGQSGPCQSGPEMMEMPDGGPGAPPEF